MGNVPFRTQKFVPNRQLLLPKTVAYYGKPIRATGPVQVFFKQNTPGMKGDQADRADPSI